MENKSKTKYILFAAPEMAAEFLKSGLPEPYTNDTEIISTHLLYKAAILRLREEIEEEQKRMKLEFSLNYSKAEDVFVKGYDGDSRHYHKGYIELFNELENSGDDSKDQGQDTE